MNESSFFRSMVNVEVGGIASSISENKAKQEENHALKDINEQQRQ